MECVDCSGVPLNLKEDEHSLEWIHGLHHGVLRLEYVSTSLSHEASYCLNLSIPEDNSLMTKLLDRLYSYVHDSSQRLPWWFTRHSVARPRFFAVVFGVCVDVFAALCLWR